MARRGEFAKYVKCINHIVKMRNVCNNDIAKVGKEENRLLLKRDDVSSTRYAGYYDVNDSKFITIDCGPDGSINYVQLNGDSLDNSSLFKAIGLAYLENVCCGDNNEYLDTDMLAAAEHCFSEVC